MRVSGDRIRHELDLILQEAGPERHLARLAELGILAEIHPDLTADGNLAGHFAAIRSTRAVRDTRFGLWAAWLSDLPVVSLDGILARLSFSTRQIEAIRHVSALRILFAGLSPQSRFSEIHDKLQPFDSEPFHIALALCDDEPLRAHLLAYDGRLRTCKPVTTGEYLQALGLRPGPLYHEILSQLQIAYLDGQIANPDEERALVHKLVEREM
jgi:tRNA nucleotidyltransferase (CCA-adding enzyme)